MKGTDQFTQYQQRMRDKFKAQEERPSAAMREILAQ